MKPEISILLPSLRPELVNKTIKEFEFTNSNTRYEIVVVSPFEVLGSKVKWIKEIEQFGSVYATNTALTFSQANYVVYFSDDVSPTKDCLRYMLNLVSSHPSPFIGAFKMQTQSAKEIGPFGAYNRLYACYGCLHRNTINLLGQLFHSDFKYSWADIDLSLKCWEMEGKVEICQESIVIPKQIEDSIYKSHREKYWKQDVDTFIKKWHNKLGKGLEPIEGVINRRLIG